MIKTLSYLAADPKIRRAMEEQHFAELDVILWNKALEQKEDTIAKQGNTIVKQGNTITALQSNNTALQNQLEEYQRRYGKLNSTPN